MLHGAPPFLFVHLATRGIIVHGPGIKPRPPEMGAQSLNEWTAREVLLPQVFASTCPPAFILFL